jgi:hypothetical protein
MPEYSVQFVVIREIVVNSHSDIQAEKDAYAELNHYDRDNVVALVVLEGDDREGGLKGDPYEAWKFVKENFQIAPLTFLQEIEPPKHSP